MTPRKFYQLTCAKHTLELGRRTYIMGIVNVTPDSFSDGGKFYATDAAVARGEKLAAAGADIIDVGGESTRPFSAAVPVEEEIRRVIPVIEKLAPRVAVPLSIDTNKAAVAHRAMEAGAALINDVSALRFDPGLAAVAAAYDAPVILMHMLGNPKTMQVSPHYDHLIAEIRQFLIDALGRAEKLGVSRSKMIIDPGIGFGKTVEHNLLLIKHLGEFSDLEAPILVGPSRKAFIRKILKEADGEDLRPGQAIVETGTQASLAAAVINGAHIVRVHDVANTRATVKILDALINAELHPAAQERA
jgi:dihydropteroate synthase